MTRRIVTPPDGFIAPFEHIEDLHSLLRSGLRPKGLLRPLLTSACPLHVAMKGASSFLMITLTTLT
jgi:hypothetical protein